MSMTTGTVTDLLHKGMVNTTAIASTTTESSLFAASPFNQPVFDGRFFDGPNVSGRSGTLKLWGYFSNTGTPTMTWTVRLGETAGASFITGTKLAESAAITTASGISNKMWQMTVDFIVRAAGQGSGACTIWANGWVESYGGFASPFKYAMTAGSGEGTTVTSTHNALVSLYVNATMTWGTSNAANTALCTGWKLIADN